MKLSLNSMRGYLSKSVSSINRNKVNGMLAEIDLRKTLSDLHFAERISIGGWVFRSTGAGQFAHDTVVVFPETIVPNQDYSLGRELPEPPRRLHTICATFSRI